MSGLATLLICSDIHYASDAEKRRIGYELEIIDHPLQRLLVRFYRHVFWLRDPFAHNHLLDRILQPPFEPDWVIANGDYSCDSAFIGVADPAARESAEECLGKLRGRYEARFHAVFGDHELGKTSLCGGRGGLRLKSFEVAQNHLGLEPIWRRRIGRYMLIGITSSLAAMEVYAHETLESERSAWCELSRAHLAEIAATFEQLRADDRVLLFCHDPTALPYLSEIPAVRSRLGQIERTIIGHLHSDLILWQSRVLRGIPRITFCGMTVQRMTAALSRARAWRDFNLLLCPSPAGIELLRRGGFYTAEIDPDAGQPARFQRHVIKR
jgi:hypothetical protein